MAGEKLIVDNRRARHDYELLERFEAGMVLTGTEVKSLRDGRVSLAQAYADVRDGEVWLVGADISVYEQGNIANHEPGRDRKLLLHKGEIDSLIGKVREKGLTLVPTRMYWKNGRAKIELALGRGKQQRDKRRDIAKREADRDMQRALKSRARAASRSSGSSGRPRTAPSTGSARSRRTCTGRAPRGPRCRSRAASSCSRATRAASSRCSRITRPRPRPRWAGRTYMRRSSPVSLSSRPTPPQAIGSPLLEGDEEGAVRRLEVLGARHRAGAGAAVVALGQLGLLRVGHRLRERGAEGLRADLDRTTPARLHWERTHIRGRPGFDVVGSPAELQVEVPGRPRKTTGKPT